MSLDFSSHRPVKDHTMTPTACAFTLAAPMSSNDVAAHTDATPTLDSSSSSSFDVPGPHPPLNGNVDARPPDPEGSQIHIHPIGDVDPQILEALKTKDRLYVLKLGELMEGLLNDRRARVDLTPATSYQRLLVHRCCAYYKLSPEGDPITKSIAVIATAESRIPTLRLRELVPAEPMAQPAFKIMRRAQDRRSKTQSQAGSVAGEDADLSDVEPSESGSLGGRSNATGGSNKKRMTIEEREAAYNEARSRIFMGFGEKDKEKDSSASSSTFSLVGSASTSGGGGSSIGDLDDSASTAATESEWSGPNSRDKKEGRRGSGNGSVLSSSRSLRSNAPPFNGSGSGSSRGSRAPSPAFIYPSLYEAPQPLPYDPNLIPGQVPPGNGPPYLYQYPPPGQPPNPAYYQYYPPYPYQHPLQSPAANPSTPPGAEMYHYQHMPYANPYGWMPPNQLPPPMVHPHSIVQHPHQNSDQTNQPPPHNAMPYPGTYMPPPASYPPYPMPGYYTPNMTQTMPPPPMPAFSSEPNLLAGASANRPNNNGSLGNSNPSRASSRSSTGSGALNSNLKRGAPPTRASYSYGPGVTIGGFGAGAMNGGSAGGGEIVGPRLSSRKISGTSSGSASNRTCDEASSTASSSTTSSSSRRTYTSTSSHPLPARPDWAVGLKPQPTLHPPHSRHHDHSVSNSRTMSPARNGIQLPNTMTPHQSHSQQLPPVLLQSTDFPPLTSLASTQEKRAPVVAGAWTNSSSTRSILMPTATHANSSTNALVHHPHAHGNTPRVEESDRAFERPPPKSTAELYNPKIVRRPTGNSNKASGPGQEKEREQVVASAVLISQVASISLDGQKTDSSVVATDGPTLVITS